jgi:hypothetical protein
VAAADATRVVMEFIEGQRLLAFLHAEPSPHACRRTLSLVLGQVTSPIIFSYVR